MVLCLIKPEIIINEENREAIKCHYIFKSHSNIFVLVSHHFIRQILHIIVREILVSVDGGYI